MFLLKRIELMVELLVFLSITLVTGVASAGSGTIGDPPRSNCHLALSDIPASNAGKIHQVFERDDDSESAAYVGLSHTVLLDLMRTGQLQIPKLFIESASLNLTDEHPVSAKLIATRSRWKDEDWSRSAARERANVSAQKFSTYDVIMDRIKKRAKRTIDTEKAANFIYEILSNLMEIGWGGLKRDYYSASYAQFRLLIADADIPFSEPTIISKDLPSNLKNLLNIGEDYQELMINQKVVNFAKAIGYSTQDIFETNSEAQMKLAALFAALPQEAGYVVGLKDSAVANKNPDKALVGVLDLDDIVEIEPLGDTEYSFLDSLKLLVPR